MALSLGRTVEELKATLTPQELTEWAAYYQLEPWGAWRDNFHHAQLAQLYYNAHAKPGNRAKLSAFMFEDAEVTAERQADQFIAYLSARAKKNG